MSRTQSRPNFYVQANTLAARVSSLERLVATNATKDVNTTGLTSAQIDALVFGGSSQPADGVIVTDSTNTILLARMSGKWCKTAALTIIT